MSPTARTVLERVLVVLASIAIVLALTVGYVKRAAVDSDQFANRASAALRDDSVRSLVAQQITDQVVLENESDLIAARPIIESIAEQVVGGGAFGGLFRAGVRDVHRALFEGDQHTLTLTLGDVGTVLASALQAVRPELAAKVRAGGRVELVRRDVGSVSASAARAAHEVSVLALLLTIAAALLVIAAVAVSPDRRRTFVRLGTGAAIGGVVLIVAWSVLRGVAVGQLTGAEQRAAAGAVWDAFLGDLRTAAWILAAASAVVAASAASLLRPVALGAPLQRAWEWLATEPATPTWRALRGLAIALAGVLFIVERDAIVTLAVTVLGVYLVYAGVSAVQRVIYRPRETAAESPGARRSLLARHRTVLTTGLAAAIVAGAVAAFVGAGGTTTAAPPVGTCNGHAVLCDRPLDEVALPATHNSMSVPAPGWYSAEQDGDIAAQLRAGIRGLLIDTHYADRLSDGRLRTYVGDPDDLRRQAAQDGVSGEAVDAALRLRERLGFSGKGQRGMYLCHSFCELGGTPLQDALGDIHDFLVANPGEVLVVINQDYVTPKDFASAVERAGLGDMAYDGPLDDLPTLREMIASGRRVVFLAENHAGGAPWYRLAYERATEETPYALKKVDQLIGKESLAASCRPNRGPSSAPLFLVNHWITTDPLPLPSNAEKVNAYEPLLARLRECERVREHLPNLVAVNFYERGDLFAVVDEINGLADRDQPVIRGR